MISWQFSNRRMAWLLILSMRPFFSCLVLSLYFKRRAPRWSIYGNRQMHLYSLYLLLYNPHHRCRVVGSFVQQWTSGLLQVCLCNLICGPCWILIGVATDRRVVIPSFLRYLVVPLSCGRVLHKRYHFALQHPCCVS